jgi:integrase
LNEGGGSWIARRFIGKGRYSEKRLGLADDLQTADGTTILSFKEAQTAARTWWKSEERRRRGLRVDDGPYTVQQACEDYLKHYVARGKKSEYTIGLTIKVHIVPALGKFEAASLNTKQIRDWHHALVTAPKRVRTGRTASETNTRGVSHSDSEAMRSRRATANRILTVLKAALNHAFQEGFVASNDSWRAVKPYHGVETALVRYLSPDECRRLVNASDETIRPMVQAALLTGARYSELARLQVGDVNLQAKDIVIREAKAGKPRHIVLTDEAVGFFRPLLAGQSPLSLMFRRRDGNQWKSAQQTRPLTEACRIAQIKPAIGFHVLRHTHGSLLAMKGVPLGVIAQQLGHADTRVTERHYAHLSPSYVSDTIRSSFPNLGITRPNSSLVAIADKAKTDKVVHSSKNSKRATA